MLSACANVLWNSSTEFENYSEYLKKVNLSIHMLAVVCVYSGVIPILYLSELGIPAETLVN